MKTVSFAVGICVTVLALAGCQSGGSNSSVSASNPTSIPITAPPANQGGSEGTTAPPANQGGGGTTTAPSIPGVMYAVAGKVTGGTVAGVTVTVTGSGGVTFSGDTATTDKNGEYTLKGLPSGTYTVTPSLGSVVFTPPSQLVTVGGDVTGVDFTDPFPLLKEGTVVYSHNQDAVSEKSLVTGVQTIVVKTPGQQIINITPFRNKNEIAFEGYNINGIMTTSLLSPAPVVATDGNMGSGCDGIAWYFTIYHDAIVTPIACSTSPTNSWSNIFIIKMDGSTPVRITSKEEWDMSTVVVDLASGKVAVLYIKTAAGSSGVLPFWFDAKSTIMEQVVDLVNSPTLVGNPTVFEENAVSTVRGLTVNPSRTKVAFVRSVNGVDHIFVKPVSGDEVAVDIGSGTNPYWSTYEIGGSSLIFYIENQKEFAVRPDGTGRVRVALPGDYWGDPSWVVPAPPAS